MFIRILGTAILGLGITVSAQADPVDCSDGCNMMSCDDSTCAVWTCSADGCTEDASFEWKDRKAGDSVQPLYGKGQGLDCGTAACTVKACDNSECRLIGFEKGEMIPLATLANTESELQSIADRFEAQGNASEAAD